MKIGLLFNKGAMWVGWHWSNHNKRLCVNLVPCFTVWVCMPNGKVPRDIVTG